MRSPVVIIYNPAARSATRNKLDAVVSFLDRKGFRAEVFLTAGKGDAEAMAARAVSLRPAMIIAAGGDGTINEVVNGMAWSDVPLAIIPFGTTNVLARELFGRHNPSDILKSITSLEPRTVSLGKITSGGNARYFCLMAGIGYDGMVVRDVSLRIKRFTGPGAYILSGLASLLRHAPGELLFKVDGIEHSGYMAVIGNISRYGGDFRVTPDARIDEPALYACISGGRRRLDVLRFIFSLPSGRHLTAPDVVYMKADTIEISGSAPVQIDGDYFGETPASITVAPNALRLIY